MPYMIFMPRTIVLILSLSKDAPTEMQRAMRLPSPSRENSFISPLANSNPVVQMTRRQAARRDFA